MEYRADINGLRAIAVLSVIAYHLSRRFSGGFFGVDIFFVISGYLISGIIFTELKSNRFSIYTFYERRIRRIVPALAVMLIVSVLLAYFYLLPYEMRQFAGSLIAAILCVSNIYFWHDAGYFEYLLTLRPLLHTWSLGVEEQFYLIFPTLLAALYCRCRAYLNLALTFLFILSLGLALVGAFHYPDANFYLAPFRAWELLLGVLIAIDVFPRIKGSPFRNVASIVGLLLIAVAVFGFSPNMPFGDLAAIVPCLGCALIIAAGRSGRSYVGVALSAKPIVYIGLISYSLYLWHWPLIVFQNMGFLRSGVNSPKFDKLLIVMLSLALATISWKFVETPFRTRRISRRAVLRFAGASTTILTLIGIIVLAANGIPNRFPPRVIEMADYLNYDTTEPTRLGKCFVGSYSQYDPSLCLKEESNKKNYLLIGDSHAAHLWPGLNKIFRNVNIMQATAWGCKPTVARYPTDTADCAALMDNIYKNYLLRHELDGVLIEAKWEYGDLPALPETLKYLKEHVGTVVLFGPMVQYDAPLPRLISLSLLRNDPDYVLRHRRNEYMELDKQIAKIARDNDVNYVSFFQILCHPPDCTTMSDSGSPLLFDESHLTADGAGQVALDFRNRGGLRQ